MRRRGISPLCLTFLMAWGAFNSVPAYADAANVVATVETSDRSGLSASDVRVMLDKIKARESTQEDADQWERQSEAGDLEAHARLLCWRYWHMMQVRSHERNQEKWGGFRKTRDE